MYYLYFTIILYDIRLKKLNQTKFHIYFSLVTVLNPITIFIRSPTTAVNLSIYILNIPSRNPPFPLLHSTSLLPPYTSSTKNHTLSSSRIHPYIHIAIYIPGSVKASGTTVELYYLCSFAAGCVLMLQVVYLSNTLRQ